MKATLEFDMDRRTDVLAHIRAVQATSAYLVLFDMQEYLIRRYKHTDAPSDEAYEVFKETKQKFFDLMNDRGIDLDRELE